jgi:hypothetical protein
MICVMMVGACVASTLEEMELNAQGKGITCRAFHFTGQRLCREISLSLFQTLCAMSKSLIDSKTLGSRAS